MGRLDYDNDFSTEISLIIDQYFRGNGLALILIRELVEKSKYDFIRAKVHEKNRASIKSFFSAGFQKDKGLFFYKKPSLVNEV
jgi:RimJ/RimL family protein N-acetyltransferase